jgi:hypothetical protein
MEIFAECGILAKCGTKMQKSAFVFVTFFYGNCSILPVDI